MKESQRNWREQQRNMRVQQKSMREHEMFKLIRSQNKSYVSLRTRLVLVVAIELVICVLIASFMTELLNRYFQIDSRIIMVVDLLAISILVGVFLTSLLSRLFFDPIKNLGEAMERVADGDFTVHLEIQSSMAKEIQEIYSGFNMMTTELDATEVLQSDFVSNVSHEFKTPINAIEGYTTLLQDCENFNDDQKEYVEKILFNTKRLSSLVGNILLLSKIENQSIQTHLNQFRLDEQIRQSVVVLESAWIQKDIEFDVDMESILYHGNEKLLHHVWDNLISNAIKFSPRGGLIRMTLKCIDDATIEFVIEDNGPGLNSESQKYIFDKFYQADSSHKEEGNGLGLALVKRILCITDGEVSAENMEQGGCRFTVILHR